jgi:hypothetical protein
VISRKHEAGVLVTEPGVRQYLWRDVYLLPMLARSGNDGVLSRAEFVGCTIIGPAVVVLMDSVVEGCSTTADVEQVWWTGKAPDGVLPVGAVGLRHCVFRDCVFEQIGFAAWPGIMRPDLVPASRGRRVRPRRPPTDLE